MISTFYDKETLQIKFHHLKTLNDIFTAIENEKVLNGEVVCQFIVNDICLFEEDEERLAQAKVEEVNSIEVKSEKPDILINKMIEGCQNEIPKLLENVDILSQKIRFEGMEHNLTGVIQLIDSTQYLIDSLMLLESFLKSQSEDLLMKWNQCGELTVRAIGEVLNTFEKKDFTLLADILEYDLANSLQYWLNILKDLVHESNTLDRKRS